jgi:PST family polysaccharide transporter
MGGESLRSRTRKGLAWAATEAGLKFVIQFGIMAALARLLSESERGVSDAALVVVGISLIFSQLGVGPAIVQRQELEARHEDAAFWVSLAFGVICAGLLWGLSPTIAALMKMPSLAGVLAVLSIVFPIAAMAVVPESLLQRNLRFDVLARAELISFVAGSGVVSISCAAAGQGVWSIVLGYLVQSILRSLLVIGFYGWRTPGRFCANAFKDLLAFSGGVTFARVANYLATNGDKLVVGRVLGESALGFYGRAYQIMVAPANLIGQVIEKVLFPALSKAQDDRQKLGRAYCQGMRFLGLVMIPMGIAISVVAHELIVVILGAKWGPAASPLAVFAGGLLFKTEMKLSNSVIRACGAAFQMAWCQVVYMVAVLVGAIVAPQLVQAELRLTAVSLGVLGAIGVCYFQSAAICRKLVGISWRKLLAEHMPGLVLGVAVLSAGLLSSHGLRSLTHSEVVVLVGSGCVMALVALVPLALLPDRVVGLEAARMRGRALSMLGLARGGANA